MTVPSGLITTVPLVGLLVITKLSGSRLPSGSLSLPKILRVTGTFGSVEPLVSLVVGGLLGTVVTGMVTVATLLAAPLLSFAT